MTGKSQMFCLFKKAENGFLGGQLSKNGFMVVVSADAD